MPRGYVTMQPVYKTSEAPPADHSFLSILLVLTAGGSAGIGKATALAFDKNGCKVAILGRRKERLDAVVRSVVHCFPLRTRQLHA